MPQVLLLSLKKINFITYSQYLLVFKIFHFFQSPVGMVVDYSTKRKGSPGGKCVNIATGAGAVRRTARDLRADESRPKELAGKKRCPSGKIRGGWIGRDRVDSKSA